MTSYPAGRRPETSFKPDHCHPTGSVVSLLHSTPMHIIAGAEWKWREGGRVAPRCLPVTNLVLYHEGRGDIEVGDRSIRIAQKETLVLIPRGHHQCAAHDPGEPFRASSLHCKLQPQGTLQDLLLALGAPTHIALNPKHDQAIIDGFKEITRLGALRPATWQVRANAHLLLIIHHLVSAYGKLLDPQNAMREDKESARLIPLLQFIDQSIKNGPIFLEDLSRASKLGPESLRRLFHSRVGMSTNRYIQSRRIEIACDLLQSSDMVIADIAMAVGFDDITAFHRLFKKWMKTTPKKWRAGEQTLD